MPWFTLVLFLVGPKVLSLCQKFVPCIVVLPLPPQAEQCCDTLGFCKAAQQFKYLYLISTVSAADKVKVKDVQGVLFADCPRQGCNSMGMAMWSWSRGSSLLGHCLWQWTPRTERNRRNFLCSYSHLPICS